MFLNKIRDIFCVRNIVAARAGKRGNILGNNVSSFPSALTPCVTAVDVANRNINMRHCFLTLNTPEKHLTTEKTLDIILECFAYYSADYIAVNT